ncbi:oligosaccharide repeat unit polymerase [candidate division WOR-3 bacterium]|nr:oligosaccharide repeat unit polymerase [candidate division WOR-3 bacterium]
MRIKYFKEVKITFPCSIVTFLIIGAISIFFIVQEQRERIYSLNLTHWFFIIVFFFITPLIQYSFGNFPLWLSKEEGFSICSTNLLILTWLVFYQLGYSIKKKRLDDLFSSLKRLEIGKRGVYFSIYLSFIIFIAFLLVFGAKNLLIRGAYREVLVSIPYNPLMIIIDKFFRFIPLLSLAGLIILKNKWANKLEWRILLLALILINLLVNNPLATPRYWAGTIILGFTAMLLKKLNRGKGFLAAMLLIGMLFIFPLTHVLRYRTAETVSLSDLRFGELKTAYTSPHFDAYEMSVHTIQYVAKEGITWGKQLAGPLLFWIPRALWKGKPVGSGGTVAIYFSYPQTNLSCPLPFEGYINFGLIGLTLFAVLTGVLFSLLDAYHWKISTSASTDIISLYYPFFLGFSLFAMRGDLMSSFSYTIMFIAAGLILLVK